MSIESKLHRDQVSYCSRGGVTGKGDYYLVELSAEKKGLAEAGGGRGSDPGASQMGGMKGLDNTFFVRPAPPGVCKRREGLKGLRGYRMG